MDITEIRIKLCSNSKERLLGFCSITIDSAFVVRDLKIIGGGKGAFVAMPSRKLCDRCSDCGCKNHLRANFCSQCGRQLDEARADRDEQGRAKLFADIAHPINSMCRDLIQSKVLQAFEQEMILAQQPGYLCRYDDFGEEEGYSEVEAESPVELPLSPQHRRDPARHVPQAPHSVSQRKQSVAQRTNFDNESFGDGIFS